MGAGPRNGGREGSTHTHTLVPSLPACGGQSGTNEPRAQARSHVTGGMRSRSPLVICRCIMIFSKCDDETMWGRGDASLQLCGSTVACAM